MDFKNIVLLIVSILLIVESVYLLISNHKSRRNIKNQFDINKYDATNQLIEKKHTMEKEMASQLEQQLIEARRAAEQEIKQIEQSNQDTISLKEKELNVILNGYEEQQRRGKEELEQRLQNYKNDDLAAQRRRQIEQEALLKEETTKYTTQLNALADDYKDRKERLDKDFFDYSERICLKKTQLQEEIDNFQRKQQEIISRFKADEEKRQNANFYKIKLNEVEQADVMKLKSLALSFSKPEILYKLIYEVYYKTRLEELFKRILAENRERGGIYKITNIKNNKVYIGKCAKFIDRWRLHSKRGCGIERINGQLYDTMFNEGLENFTWEIVEICPRNEQADKEKYWIDFYKSNEYGYNMRRG